MISCHFSDDRVEHRLIQLEALGILNALDTHIELHHHILRRHLLAQLEFLFKLVSLDDFLQVLHRDVLRVEAGKGIGAFLQVVDSEVAHLTVAVSTNPDRAKDKINFLLMVVILVYNSCTICLYEAQR